MKQLAFELTFLAPELMVSLPHSAATWTSRVLNKVSVGRQLAAESNGIRMGFGIEQLRPWHHDDGNCEEIILFPHLQNGFHNSSCSRVLVWIWLNPLCSETRDQELIGACSKQSFVVRVKQEQGLAALQDSRAAEYMVIIIGIRTCMQQAFSMPVNTDSLCTQDNWGPGAFNPQWVEQWKLDALPQWPPFKNAFRNIWKFCQGLCHWLWRT